ncbi:MAG: apolipoprotein N-acyltransferase [Candidatus Anaerobiospirillum merdipullorum]|uniref:Apolipoprotein N-acyltransferase n=1 Tax=Candidatus Anaerobiospirillum merdipullorum TaxID=2838450 RepID=A0A9E2KND5_9GAMM|nr:apolipoprotein N-acyltransferase [Candidatus Anaerobiospirillum merdipullorum]
MNKLRYYLEKLGDVALWQRLFSTKWGTILFPTLLGLLTSGGFAPLGMWPLTLAGLSLSLALCAFYQRPGQIFWMVWSYFTALCTASLWWLNFVLEDFGALPVPLSWLVVFIFALYLSLPYALLSALLKRYFKEQRAEFICCLLPPAWVLADYIVGWLFTGFPWVYVGYSALQGPLSAFAPLLGVHGINLLFYLCAAAIALALYRKFIFLPIAGLIFIVGVMCAGLSFTTPQDKLEASLVQGNIAQSVKWRPEMVAPTLATYWQLTQDELAPGRLIVWPESAVPLLMERAEDILQSLNAVAHEKGALLITGVQHRDKQDKVHNSLVLLGDNATFATSADLPRYDKRKLVPFGEVVPFATLLRPLGSIFNFPMSSFSPGAQKQSPLQVFDSYAIPAICYESIFPQAINALNTKEAGFILMLSNDSWFGTTAGPIQHLNIARMRCLELQKPMLRATNSGVTALIGADGKVLKALAQQQSGVLRVTVQTRTGLTPYARLGETSTIVLALLLFTIGLWHSRKPRNRQREALEQLVRP